MEGPWSVAEKRRRTARRTTRSRPTSCRCRARRRRRTSMRATVGKTPTWPVRSTSGCRFKVSGHVAGARLLRRSGSSTSRPGEWSRAMTTVRPAVRVDAVYARQRGDPGRERPRHQRVRRFGVDDLAHAVHPAPPAHPHEIQIDFGASYAVRACAFSRARTRTRMVWSRATSSTLAMDSTNWTAVASGTLDSTRDERLRVFPTCRPLHSSGGLERDQRQGLHELGGAGPGPGQVAIAIRKKRKARGRDRTSGARRAACRGQNALGRPSTRSAT